VILFHSFPDKLRETKERNSMPGMMASNRNRAANNVDSTMFDDGFWQHRRFKGKRKAGAPTGSRGWRRVLRAKEKTQTRQDYLNNQM
jgi:hypothetical protein